jgi:hypothetical protein
VQVVYIIRVKTEFVGIDYQPKVTEYYFDGWTRSDGSFYFKKEIGIRQLSAGLSSLYSHGRSVGFLPPSGKIYEVELLMGGVSSYRKEVFEKTTIFKLF